MSLANFFDKTVLGAAGVLKNFDRQSFATLLEKEVVSIIFDEETSKRQEGQTLLDLVTNLSARLFPRIRLQGADASGYCDKLIATASAINPQISIEAEPLGSAYKIVVGKSAPSGMERAIYLGSDAWIARLSSDKALGCANTKNPFGAAAAACLGIANVFRMMFSEQLPGSGADKSLEWSVLDLNTGAESSNPAWVPPDLTETHLVGLGAIGNGAVWVLRRLRDVSGTLHLIDPEAIELTNLQRYVLTSQSDTGRPKVQVAAHDWGSSLKVELHQMTWAQYLDTRKDWSIARVAVALDSAKHRCAVQAALPKRILNSWTRGSNLGISRHNFLGDEACLMCLYLPDAAEKSEDELIADAIGLPAASREVREMLYQNIPIGRGWINRIGQALQIEVESLLPFEDKSMRHFYSEAVCGGVLMRLGKSSSPTEVPMAFQSALAGVLLAAEVVIDAGRYRSVPLASVSQIDLLRPMPLYPTLPARKDSRGRCICQDGDYISAYKAKYGESAISR